MLAAENDARGRAGMTGPGGQTVRLSGSGTDPDAGERLAYAWRQTAGTTVVLSSSSAASPTFTAPAGLGADEALSFTLRVTDAGGLSAEDSVTVTVSAICSGAP